MVWKPAAAGLVGCALDIHHFQIMNIGDITWIPLDIFHLPSSLDIIIIVVVVSIITLCDVPIKTMPREEAFHQFAAECRVGRKRRKTEPHCRAEGMERVPHTHCTKATVFQLATPHNQIRSDTDLTNLKVKYQVVLWKSTQDDPNGE